MNDKALIEMVGNSPLKDPVILVADRGYESYNTFAHLEEKGWNDVIRVKILKVKVLFPLWIYPIVMNLIPPIHLTLTRKQTNEVKL